MHKVVISGTGLYTPAQSISNEELVESFNAYVQQFNADNAAAIGLYTALGFAADGRRRDYYGRGHDALLMSLRLPGGPGSTVAPGGGA